MTVSLKNWMMCQQTMMFCLRVLLLNNAGPLLVLPPQQTVTQLQQPHPQVGQRNDDEHLHCK